MLNGFCTNDNVSLVVQNLVPMPLIVFIRYRETQEILDYQARRENRSVI